MPLPSWSVFFGDEYQVLRGRLGGGRESDEFLKEAIRQVLFKSKRQSVPIIKKRLLKLQRQMILVINSLTENPEIDHYLQFTDWAENLNYSPKEFPIPVPVLVDAMRTYVDAVDEIVAEIHTSAKGGKPRDATRAALLRSLIKVYVKIFGKDPTYYRDGDFHYVVVRLLIRAGYIKDGDIDSDREPDVSRAIKEAISQVRSTNISQ